MPTYDYQCSKCKKSFEVFQSMKDPAFTTCPKEQCAQKKWGKGKVQRQLGTGAGLIFKGSGFYITDYRSEGYKSAAKKDAPGGGESKGGESKGGESKGGESKGGDTAKKTDATPAAKPAASEKPKATKKPD